MKATRVFVYQFLTFHLARKKGCAWNEGFGFELLNAYVFFLPGFDSGGLLRGRTSGFQDSEPSGGARVCKRSFSQKGSPAAAVEVTVPVPERVGPSDPCLQGINMHFPLLLLC